MDAIRTTPSGFAGSPITTSSPSLLVITSIVADLLPLFLSKEISRSLREPPTLILPKDWMCCQCKITSSGIALSIVLLKVYFLLIQPLERASRSEFALSASFRYHPEASYPSMDN